MKVSNRLQEKYDYHANDKTNDMHSHFDILSDIASNCEHVTELGVRGICSSWAFLRGMASMPNRFVTVTPEERTKLYMISAKLLVSIDHIHPNDFGGNLKEFEEIAKENDVNTKFIKSSSLEIELDETQLIFFDTDHNYEQLKRELVLHGNKSTRYLAFHDTTRFAKELIPAINEFLENTDEWIVAHQTNECQGLVVLGRFSVDYFNSMQKNNIDAEQSRTLRPEYEDHPDVE